MSFVKQNGYVAGALMFLPQIRQMRDMLEFEKFQCRVLVDDDRTREFKKKTEEHKNSIYALRYNSEQANKITAEGKKDGTKSGT